MLPLTPAGNATERHIVVAYIEAAAAHGGRSGRLLGRRLGMDREAVEKAMADSAGFQNTVRNKLMKKGGPGYVQPGPDTFPPVEKLNELAVACRALPCAAWLDGTSAGEESYEELLGLLVAKGIVALNIVPDRNWNFADEKAAALKQQKLYEVVDLARQIDLPLNVGTEMNSFGQKIVDDFDAPALAPCATLFWMAPTLSTVTRFWSAATAWAIRAPGPRAICRHGRSATHFYTAGGQAACHPAPPAATCWLAVTQRHGAGGTPGVLAA